MAQYNSMQKWNARQGNYSEEKNQRILESTSESGVTDAASSLYDDPSDNVVPTSSVNYDAETDVPGGNIDETGTDSDGNTTVVTDSGNEVSITNDNQDSQTQTPDSIAGVNIPDPPENSTTPDGDGPNQDGPGEPNSGPGSNFRTGNDGSSNGSDDSDVSPDTGPSTDPPQGDMGLSDQDIMDLPDDLGDNSGLIIGAAVIAGLALLGGS